MSRPVVAILYPFDATKHSQLANVNFHIVAVCHNPATLWSGREGEHHRGIRIVVHREP